MNDIVNEVVDDWEAQFEDPDEDFARAEADMVFAVRNGDYDTLDAYLANGYDPDARDENGNTLLMLAAKNGDCDIINLLASYDADLDLINKNSEAGWTALKLAVMSGEPSAAIALIQCGANVNMIGRDGKTLQDLCREKEYWDVLRAIVHANRG